MKRCPQCNSVFEDDKAFCPKDGISLVNDTFSLPSDFAPEDFDDDDEQQTIIRLPQKRIKTSKPKIAPQPELPKVQAEVNEYAPIHDNISPQTPPKESGGCLKYSIILILGLLIGGGIVLGFVAASYYYFYNDVTKGSQTLEESTDKSDENTDNKDSEKIVAGDHSKPNPSANESKLNGQIIKKTATLRSKPDSQAQRVDTLPKNDRIEIIKRRSSTSKWYQVKCEHGSKGWIDGYLIKFTE